MLSTLLPCSGPSLVREMSAFFSATTRGRAPLFAGSFPSQFFALDI